ncbi:MAG: hypothetical protein IJB45_01930 [Clostridia bacterium]|nr:hypothetical protein [Clostridia bacterium]
MLEFKNIYANEKSAKAAEILINEINSRMNKRPELCDSRSKADVLFEINESISRDGYSVSVDNNRIILSASGTRGFIYAVGMLLRKIVLVNGEIALVSDISGDYEPDKAIRGHQIGYRTTPNTYDAWSYEDYARYYLDMMFFGTNTVEHIPYERGVSNRNRLMKYDEEDFLVEASKMADELDLDVSLWHPNNDGETVEQAVERRRKLYARVPRLDVVFPPGGDPGEFPPEEFVLRCTEISKALKAEHPNAQMWPSAQQPHSFPDWGERFIEEMEKLPEEIDGVITGPNKAFEIDELRRRLPSKYPIRLYPDITHNLRCEYPVHFDRDDWHFAFAAGLSRECTNPRPREYRQIHRATRRYVIGSVSYSEGVSDDVNKMVWADMDYFPDCDLRETLLDYCRLFFFGADAEKLADGIMMLEQNWECDPAENPVIDKTLELFNELRRDYPFLSNNWRYLQLLLRAECDWILRHRRVFELNLIRKAEKAAEKGDLELVREILSADFEAEYKGVRAEIDEIAKTLFDIIGMQLDIEHYCANNWERGAILETIDLPVTDRSWLLNRLEYSAGTSDPVSFMRRAFNRNKVDADEYYFSVAQNGLAECGVAQTGEVYMNIQGDRPNVNNGSMPTCMFTVYDNLTFKCKIGGMTHEGDYLLTVTYASKKNGSEKHKISVNGFVVYEGKQFGEFVNPEYDREMLAPGFETAGCIIPRNMIVNGCIELELSEPSMGVMFSEFRITKA